MKTALTALLLTLPAALPAAETPAPAPEKSMPAETETAIFGGGCFWCTEAVFETEPGVTDVQSGYSGGQKENPTYRDVCTGTTGHAEVVSITFDPEKVSYEKLVRLFFGSHDPTTLNQQGADVGTQYRSAIYTTSEAQREVAEKVKAELDASGKFKKPIVTEIKGAAAFFAAEKYHQDYYRSNPDAPYSQYIRQKMKKLGRE